MAGEYGSTNVPPKAIAAQEVIYQGSSALAVVKPLVGSLMYDELTYKVDVTIGDEGQDDVQLSGNTSDVRLDYTTLSANMLWSKYKYLISDEAKLNSRDENSLWDNAMQSGSEYLASIIDYRILTALVAGAGNTATAANYWNVSAGDPEGDIVTAIEKIMANSNTQQNERIAVVVPRKVDLTLQKLDLIKNVQQQMKDYLQKSFNLDIVGYRPRVKNGTAKNDALDNDVLVFVEGKNTCMFAQYDPAAAAAKGVPLVESARVQDRGEQYSQRMASCARVIWDCDTSHANTITNRIYKISNVVSSAL